MRSPSVTKIMHNLWKQSLWSCAGANAKTGSVRTRSACFTGPLASCQFRKKARMGSPPRKALGTSDRAATRALLTICTRDTHQKKTGDPLHARQTGPKARLASTLFFGRAPGHEDPPCKRVVRRAMYTARV